MRPASSVDPKFSTKGLVHEAALQLRLRDKKSAETLAEWQILVLQRGHGQRMALL